MRTFNYLNSIFLLEYKFLKKKIPIFQIGDTVKIGVKINEGNKKRIQFYEGIIIAKKNYSINLMINVRKFLQGNNIERLFLPHSPNIESINILKNRKIRRSKLYFMRYLKTKIL